MANEVVIRDIKDTTTMAKAVAESGLFGYKSINQALTMLLLAESENMHPMSAVKQYHIVNGKPVLKSAEVLSRFQNAKGSIKYISSTDEKCEIEFTHPQGGSLTIKWDIAKAKKAGIYDTNAVWKKYPSNMLRARCITDGVTALFPSCLGGNMPETVAEDIPLPKFEYEEAEVVEDTPKLNLKLEKTKLKKKMEDLNFSIKEIKEFAQHFNITDDADAIHELNNNDVAFTKSVNEFEEILKGNEDDSK